MRRVVVTGLGAVTPLAVGVRPTWRRLLAGESGVVSVLGQRGPRSQWQGIPSTVAGLVPEGGDAEHSWRAADWLGAGESQRMPRHTQFAIAAGDMALSDAGWEAKEDEGDMAGVSMGSGIGDLEQLFDTSLAYERGVSSISSFQSTIKLRYAKARAGLQEDTPSLRSQDPPQHGGWSHLDAALPPRTESLPHDCLCHGRRLHR